MSLFMVKIVSYGVVEAEDYSHAYSVGRDFMREISRDDFDPDIEVMHRIDEPYMVNNGWDLGCIPYGGDNATTIGKILEK
jgi:hypothetical protein